jgi:CelD/BcsL family acetyltransferase involved in cellulose biosynthesis
VFEVVGDVQRPMLKADLPSFGDYLNGVLSKRRRRDIERRRRQLETRGRLDARIVDAGDEVLRYARLFMDIEASGWKGEAGTALKCCPAERAFFETAVRRGAHAGNVILPQPRT